MKLNNDCQTYYGDKKNCTVSEKGKTFRLINNSGSKFSVYKVDGCLIKENNEQKCDHLIVIHKDQHGIAYFIELKGTGLSDAINQLMNSITLLYKSINEHKIYARIVGKRVTPNIKSRRSKLDELLKKFGGDLKIASAPELQETI
jgi:hypothetical protein